MPARTFAPPSTFPSGRPGTLPILVTRRLTMRPPLEVDAEAIAALLNNPAVSRMLGPVPHPYTLDDAFEFVRRPRDAAKMNYTVHRAALVGLMGASRRDDDGLWHYGYWFGEPYWGRGYASEALPAYLAHLFERTGAERLSSYVFADNPASLVVQRKVGAVVTGEATRPSRARGHEVPGFEMELTREAFERHHPAVRAAA